jgi:CDP-diacylglycerol--serine O-phosphatidyltransferase
MQIRIPMRLRKMKDSGKKKLFIIPYLFTFANACFGLLAVLYAWDNLYRQAALCIVCSACADALDGRLARLFNSCSLLGMELDSLCDAISFCFAPAILMYGAFLERYGVLGVAVSGIYLCAGLFRLAKFNNSSCQQKIFFIGLSTPVSAIFFAMLILHEPWLLHTSCGPYVSHVVLILALMFAYLMVSRIKFPTFKAGLYGHTLTRVTAVVVAVTTLAVLAFHKPIALSICFTYIVTAIVYHLFCE